MSEKKMIAWAFIPPEVVNLPIQKEIPGGATRWPDGIDVCADRIDYVVMSIFWFFSPHKIHGLWMKEMQNQQLFLGYKCHACGEVFLVPNSVTDVYELGAAMRHGCTELGNCSTKVPQTTL